MIYLYIADKSDDATINRELPESFVLRALSYKNDEQRADSLRGYRLIYGALCELGYGDRTEIRTGVYGKPYITDCPYRFSLSHSYGKSFCAVGRVEVGCDVEKIREIDLSIAKRFFSSDESDRVFSFSDKDAKTEFFRIWTAKESFMKVVGKGFALSPFSFSVLDKNGELCQEKDGLILKNFIKDGFCFSVFSADREYETVFPRR